MSAVPPVPLSELAPQFVRFDFTDTRFVYKLIQVDDIRIAQGIRLVCPTCREDYGPMCHKLLLPFQGRDVPVTVNGGVQWQIAGNGYADLTLMPSINAAGHGCRWHGWITNGMVSS